MGNVGPSSRETLRIRPGGGEELLRPTSLGEKEPLEKRKF